MHLNHSITYRTGSDSFSCWCFFLSSLMVPVGWQDSFAVVLGWCMNYFLVLFEIKLRNLLRPHLHGGFPASIPCPRLVGQRRQNSDHRPKQCISFQYSSKLYQNLTCMCSHALWIVVFCLWCLKNLSVLLLCQKFFKKKKSYNIPIVLLFFPTLGFTFSSWLHMLSLPDDGTIPSMANNFFL